MVKIKRISWVAWKKLCLSKEEGGLGFHDIAKFNQALLAKQAWRVWKHTDSLVARVLKSRYFRNSEFLSCGMGTRPSYAWRSLMHGKDLLKQGLVSSIGPGTETRVWAYNWIIDPIRRPPMYRPNSIIDLTRRISDLMYSNTRVWDVAKARNTFAEEDAERILSMRPHGRSSDLTVWGFTKHGAYTSKSGYSFLETLDNYNNPPATSTPPVEKQLWRAIWKTKAPTKLKHFLWKTLS